MKIEVNENREIILKEVYSGIGLESNNKEFFGICMRDSGFEFTYEGQHYSAQKGIVKKFNEGKEEEVRECLHLTVYIDDDNFTRCQNPKCNKIVD